MQYMHHGGLISFLFFCRWFVICFRFFFLSRHTYSWKSSAHAPFLTVLPPAVFSRDDLFVYFLKLSVYRIRCILIFCRRFLLLRRRSSRCLFRCLAGASQCRAIGGGVVINGVPRSGSFPGLYGRFRITNRQMGFIQRK